MYDEHGKTKMFTWFFAFLSMLVIALFLVLQVGFTVDAKEIIGSDDSAVSNTKSSSGTDNSIAWSYDDSDLKLLTEIYGINGIDVLTWEGNPNKQVIKPNTSNPNNSTYDYQFGYYRVKNDNNTSAIDSLKSQVASAKLPTSWIYGGETFSIFDYSHIYVVNQSVNEIIPYIIVTNGNLQKLYGGTFFSERLFGSDGFCFSVSSSPNITSVHDVTNSGDGQTYSVFTGAGRGLLVAGNYEYRAPIAYVDNNSVFYDGPMMDYCYDKGSFDYTARDSDETSDNNLVMDNADWIFNSSDYSPQKVIPNGNIIFTFEPNDYQIEHSDEFSIQYSFSFRSKCKYQWKNKTSTPPFYRTSSVTDNWKEFEGFYTYTGTVDTVSLSEFISNSNTTVFSWQDLFENLQGGESVDSKVLSAILRIGIEADSLNFSTFDITCTAELVTATNSSGKYTEVYNPITKQGRTEDSSGKVNPNPYIKPDENGDDEEDGTTPPDDKDTSSTTSKDGNININVTNNNTVNGGGDSSGGVTNTSEAGLFYKIFNPVKTFLNLLTVKNSSMGDELVEGFGINNYLLIIANTFSFMPAAFWLSIAGYVSAVFKILIIAFIIRIILDLL